MGNSAKRVALGGVLAALGVTLMWLTALTGLGTYLGPVMVSLTALPLLYGYGARDALLCYLTVSVLSLLLISDKEQACIYAFVIGWYPAAKPRFDRLPRWKRRAAKFAAFNAVTGALYWVLLQVIGMDVGAVTPALSVGLLAMGNVTFGLYDQMLTRITPIYFARFHRRLFGK